MKPEIYEHLYDDRIKATHGELLKPLKPM